MYKEIFSQRIKKARNDTGFTQKEIERETGIRQSDITKYENGKLEPNIEKLGILADFYEVSIDWLLGTKGTKKGEP